MTVWAKEKTMSRFTSSKKGIKLGDFVDGLPSEGRYTFTLDQVSAEVDASTVALQTAIRRMKKKGRLVSPRRSFFVIVPPEYRSTGAPPPSWFIDDLMRHMQRPYYVGLLSAAALHGAAHQQPQVFQVVTSLPMAPLTAGRARVEFFRRRSIERVATQKMTTPTGYMNVSTPETTAFDLLRHVHAAGHLSNVATVLAELGETIQSERLIEAASLASLPEIRRAGYLFQLVGREELAEALEKAAAAYWAKPSRLRPDVSDDGAPLDTRWSLFINEDVEPEL